MGLAQQALMEYSFSCVAGVAQWESTSFTRMGSAVQSCPPAFFCHLTFVELQLVIKMLQLSLKINVSSMFGTPVFRGVFFGNYNSD